MPFLPNEILLQIFEECGDAADQFAFLRVSRAWHALFLPRVYNRVTVDASRLARLACSVQESPAAGLAVHSLSIGPIETGHLAAKDERETDMQAPHPERVPHQEVLERVYIDEKDRRKWKQALQWGSSDAWLAILLFYLPSLQILEMEPGDEPITWMPGVLWAITSGSIDIQPLPLQNLERITLPLPKKCCRHPISQYRAFFLLPSMKSFRGGGIYELSDEHNIDDYPRGPEVTEKTSGITTLILDDCCGYYGMAEYITACANLEVFQYEHMCLGVKMGFEYLWRPSVIHDALTTQKESLQVLRVKDDNLADLFIDCGYAVENPDEMWFGSLVDFDVLREVSMPLHVLLDFRRNTAPTLSLDSVLPRSLEYLCLGEVEEEDYPIVATGLGAMLAQHKARFPVLERIELWIKEFRHRPEESELLQWQGAFATVLEMCGEEGVDFRCVNRHWYQVADEWRDSNGLRHEKRK